MFSPTELLSRFILERNKYSVEYMKAKPGLYIPNREGKLSVLRSTDQTEEKIWEWGNDHAAIPMGKTLYGRADCTGMLFTTLGLKVEPDDSPPRHANVVGWPEEKSKRKNLADKLAREATLVLRNY